jgi:hypothetical protein
MPRKILFLITSLFLLIPFQSRLTLLRWAPGGWAAASPGEAVPFVPELEADLDSDGIPEQVILQDRQVTIENRDRRIWTSPAAWNVHMAQITDLNRDGRPEVTMLVWRPFAPWPVDAWLPHGGRIGDFHDAENQSCHIILYGWAGDRYRELWAGSALAEPVLAFYAADWNGDGRQELAAVETDYGHETQGRAVTLWQWNGFGFTIEGRMQVGIAAFVFLIDDDGAPALLFSPSG